MVNGLKLCPYCRKQVYMYYSSADRVFKVFHSIGDEDDRCPIVTPIRIRARSIAEANSVWNGRADDGK